MSSGSSKNIIYELFVSESNIWYTYEQDLSLNNREGWYVIKPKQLTSRLVSSES